MLRSTRAMHTRLYSTKWKLPPQAPLVLGPTRLVSVGRVVDCISMPSPPPWSFSSVNFAYALARLVRVAFRPWAAACEVGTSLEERSQLAHPATGKSNTASPSAPYVLRCGMVGRSLVEMCDLTLATRSNMSSMSSSASLSCGRRFSLSSVFACARIVACV